MKDNRLEGLREEKDLKSMEVASYLKVANSSYSEWEHNKSRIPTRRLLQLANFYNVNIDYMLNLSKNKINTKYSNKFNLKIIGERLRKIRFDSGYTLRQLGTKLNTAFSSLSNYENGKTLVQSDILIEMCKLSNSAVDYVLGLTDENSL